MDKSDKALQADVIAELAWDPSVKATRLGVAVKDGIVTVTGHLDTFAEKDAAMRAVRRVSGVKAIAVEIDVMLSADHQRSDTDIARSVEAALTWNTSIPADRVRATVDHGCVNLEGEVEWEFQRHSAENAVRSLVGVVGISNQIRLRARPVAADIARQIEDALKRQAIREAGRIRIAIDGSTVTLAGTVHSWHEREAAQGVAWSAPGVRSVINELQVG